MAASVANAELTGKRAKALVAMGLVERQGDIFLVYSAAIREAGSKPYQVSRNKDSGKVACTCTLFLSTVAQEPEFRCEHILAVKYFLQSRETAASQYNLKETDVMPTQAQLEEPVEQTEQASGESPAQDSNANAQYTHLGQAATIVKTLGAPLPQGVIKTRDVTWGKGYVEYIDWVSVVDALNKTYGDNWHWIIKDMQMGESGIVCNGELTVDGVTRAGIGCGEWKRTNAGDVMMDVSVKSAASDALKRAAVLFGFALDLYRKEEDHPQGGGQRQANFSGGGQRNGGGNYSDTPRDRNGNAQDQGFGGDPVARNLADLVTAKQLGMMRAIAREMRINGDEECQSVMNCRMDELSKKAASEFIKHLQGLQDLQRPSDGGGQYFRRAT